MSWDAYLRAVVDGNEFTIPGCEWNYTHNCNRMMATVLEENGAKVDHHWLIGHMGGSWFEMLDKMSGVSGSQFLGLVISGLESNPDKFRAMNPSNGWGSYDGVLAVLRKMKAASDKYPSARWSISG